MQVVRGHIKIRHALRRPGVEDALILDRRTEDLRFMRLSSVALWQPLGTAGMVRFGPNGSRAVCTHLRIPFRLPSFGIAWHS